MNDFLACNIWHVVGIQKRLLGDPRFPNLGFNLAEKLPDAFGVWSSRRDLETYQ